MIWYVGKPHLRFPRNISDVSSEFLGIGESSDIYFAIFAVFSKILQLYHPLGRYRPVRGYNLNQEEPLFLVIGYNDIRQLAVLGYGKIQSN